MTKTSLSAAQDLCEHLLQQASRPYFDMVSRWVYEGQLQDPYGEFFVSESPRVRDERTGGPAADFWQKHFTLDERAVPQFLASGRERILHAGNWAEPWKISCFGYRVSVRALFKDISSLPQSLFKLRANLADRGKYLHIYFSASGKQLPEPIGGRAPFRYSRRRRDYAEARFFFFF